MELAAQLVGRSSEQAQLLRVLAAAGVGEPSATLVHGEPGIGKTSLIRDLVGRAEAQDIHVLSGQCLRFGSEVSAYLAFSQAFDHWSRAAGPQVVGRLFPGSSSGRDILEAAGRDAREGPPSKLFTLADAVARLVDDGPTLLVVDDLQWADPSSLDLLCYVVAGLRGGQRLAVVLTYRDTELGDGHRLHEWLADIVRMPHVSRFALHRLTAAETERLVAGLPGADVSPARAEEVYARSDGNPYLTELLAHELAGDGECSSQLSEALLGAWHRLSQGARSTTQLVAVAGRPVRLTMLAALAAQGGLCADAVADAVRDAVDNGVLILQGSGHVWFRHPLLAEVIADTLFPWQLPGLHRAFAVAWEAAEGATEAERANHLALHHAAAGDTEPALTWGLRAADEASRLGAIEEEATHLSRVVDLLPLVPSLSRPPTTELLMRAGRCQVAAGRSARAIELFERALESLDPERDPLATSRVLTVLNFTRQTNTGDESTSLIDFVRAVDLTQSFPSSKERVDALAHLAYVEVFEGNKAATGHAEEAVALAETIGEDDALSWALVVRAQTRWGTESGVGDAERALALARESQDAALLVRVTFNLCNSYESMGRLAASAAVSRDVYALMRERGSAQGISSIGSRVVQTAIPLGQWDVARTVIRDTLALRLSSRWAATARGAAAVLSALEGDATAANAHMARARELMAGVGLAEGLLLPEMNLALELGVPWRTLELVEESISHILALGPPAADECLQLAARAAADLSDRSSAASDEPRRSAVAALQRIESLRGDTPAPFVPAGEDDFIHPAWGALYAADRARCVQGGRPAADLWRTAAAATDRAGLRYEHARCLYFLGRSLLGQHKGRLDAADALNAAAAIAGELGADPLVGLVEQVARQAHLALVHPGHDDSPASRPSKKLAGVALTPRESEVLDHVVAGETYAQIARMLFISDKTVSVHVSNLLRKTGAASRVELASLAGGPPSSGKDHATGTP